jgi:hypothetical protein
MLQERLGCFLSSAYRRCEDVRIDAIIIAELELRNIWFVQVGGASLGDLSLLDSWQRIAKLRPPSPQWALSTWGRRHQPANCLLASIPSTFRANHLERAFVAPIPLRLAATVQDLFSASKTGIRSCTSATNSSGSQIIMVQNLSRYLVSGFCHSSHSPAAVSARQPRRRKT